MTNSEAIETLQANYPDSCYGLLRDAVDTAIRALSAQPEIIYCKDCVHNKSKADAGNALCELYYGMTDQMGYCHKGERGDAINEVQ